MRDYVIRPIPEGWQENVIDVQNAAYPRCKHGAPTAFIVGDRPICMACVEEDPAILMWLKSGSLVSGGVK
jgi:hypothetical protein